MNKNFLRYSIAVLVALAINFSVAAPLYWGSNSDFYTITRILFDCTFITALSFFIFGSVLGLAKLGAFNHISYAYSKLAKKEPRSYKDYTDKMSKQRNFPTFYLFAIGLLHLGFSISMLFLS